MQGTGGAQAGLDDERSVRPTGRSDRSHAERGGAPAVPLLRLTPPAGPGGFRFYIKSKCVDSGRPGLEDLDFI